MKLLPGENASDCILEFDTVAEFESFFDEADRAGFFCIQGEPLPLECIIRARCLDSPRSRRIKPFAIERDRNGSMVRLRKPDPAPEPETPPAAAEPRFAPPAAEPENDALRKSLHDQIRALSVMERAALALKADLMERRILMQENNAKIHEFLLRNARITDHEIAFMARNPAAPMQTILTILNHKEWMKRESIRSGILLNPRTPPQRVLELIPTAPSNDIIRMSFSKALRDDVQSAVQLEMKRRGLRPKKQAE